MERSRGTNVASAVVLVMLATQMASARPRPDEVEEMKKALFTVCSSKHPVTGEAISDAKNGVLSEERDFKCLIGCFFDELSLMDEEANFDSEAMFALVQDDEFKKIVEQAVNTCLPNIAGKPDPCEVSFNLMKCAIKSNKRLIETLPL